MYGFREKQIAETLKGIAINARAGNEQNQYRQTRKGVQVYNVVLDEDIPPTLFSARNTRQTQYPAVEDGTIAPSGKAWILRGENGELSHISDNQSDRIDVYNLTGFQLGKEPVRVYQAIRDAYGNFYIADAEETGDWIWITLADFQGDFSSSAQSGMITYATSNNGFSDKQYKKETPTRSSGTHIHVMRLTESVAFTRTTTTAPLWFKIRATTADNDTPYTIANNIGNLLGINTTSHSWTSPTDSVKMAAWSDQNGVHTSGNPVIWTTYRRTWKADIAGGQKTITDKIYNQSAGTTGMYYDLYNGDAIRIEVQWNIANGITGCVLVDGPIDHKPGTILFKGGTAARGWRGYPANGTEMNEMGITGYDYAIFGISNQDSIDAGSDAIKTAKFINWLQIKEASPDM